ncbi:NAD-dependent epimerase/dehydratase family protein [Clostridium neuense]|uniref:NAD-dependent epimerase/dehydratase family protein n=1 Tax=Clostridium neuense TaxID=1728934 RepID=A0ABW8TGU3_9CLOT
MNLLITGSSGFIGSNLINELELIKKHFDNIYLLSNKEIEGYTCIKYENYNFNKKIFSHIKSIDVVIHIGGYIPKISSEGNVISLCNSNITSTFDLIESLPNLPSKFIFISTTDIYENSEVIDENSKIKPISLYASSKLYCEEMLKAWAEEKNVCLQILRLGHVYGIGEYKYKKIIPIIINKIIKNEVIQLYSNGMQKRAYINVKDCCRLILNSLKLEKFVEPINIVSSTSISMIDLIELLFEISLKKVPIKRINGSSDLRSINYNNEKMIKYLGKDTISLSEGLKEEYDCFLKLLNKN